MGNVAIVHAAPQDLWRAPLVNCSDSELEETYRELAADVVCCGHIHRPFACAETSVVYSGHNIKSVGKSILLLRIGHPFSPRLLAVVLTRICTRSPPVWCRMNGPVLGLKNLKDLVAHAVGLPFADAHAHDFVQPRVFR